MILDHDGVKLSVHVFGQRNNRPALVFLNPWHVSWEMWLFQIPYFAKNFFVVCYDQRGAGDSDKPSDEDSYSFDNFTADLRFIVEQLELDTIIPVCYSIPCKVGVKYFDKYPDQVAKLILAAGNPTLNRSVNQAELISFIENDYEHAMDYYMRRCFTDSEGDTGWQLDLMMTVALKSNSFVATSILKNYYKDDIEPLLPGIDVPTLIIHGDKDIVYPVERAYRFKELIPGSILHVHKDKGHLPHLTDTENFNTTVEEFLLK